MFCPGDLYSALHRPAEDPARDCEVILSSFGKNVSLVFLHSINISCIPDLVEELLKYPLWKCLEYLPMTILKGNSWQAWSKSLECCRSKKSILDQSKKFWAGPNFFENGIKRQLLASLEQELGVL